MTAGSVVLEGVLVFAFNWPGYSHKGTWDTAMDDEVL